MAKELSLIDAAVEVMTKEKRAFELYELFDRIVEMLDIPKSSQEELVAKFYSDLTTSAKFIYVGDNQWNLKVNEKIELWEKDGSFYKEYTVVELPDEYKIDPFAKPKKSKPAPKVEKAVVEVEEITPEVVEEEVVKKERVVKEEVVEPAVEPVADKKKTGDVEEEYEEEVFEDYDDFDEEKYNEYMDNYEDKYDE